MAKPQLTYGLRNNISYHIDDVENGLNCGCVCPSCGKQLEACNNGNVRAHHFRHYQAIDCPGARMSALHILAEEVLLEDKQVRIPEFDDEYSEPSSIVKFADVQKEVSYHLGDKDIRPDCVGIDENGCETWIEILVTHKVDAAKEELICENEICCFEIDLSDLLKTEYTKEDIRERLLTEKRDRRWICPPKEYRTKAALEKKKRRLVEQQERMEVKTIVGKWKTHPSMEIIEEIIDLLNDESTTKRELLLSSICSSYTAFLKDAPKEKYIFGLLRALLLTKLPSSRDVSSAEYILEKSIMAVEPSDKQRITWQMALVVFIVGKKQNNYRSFFLKNQTHWNAILQIIAIKKGIPLLQKIESYEQAADKYPEYKYFFAWAFGRKDIMNMAEEESRLDYEVRGLLTGVIGEMIPYKISPTSAYFEAEREKYYARNQEFDKRFYN